MVAPPHVYATQKEQKMFEALQVTFIMSIVVISLIYIEKSHALNRGRAMSTRDEKAIWMPSPNKWDGRLGRTPRYIIIHGTAGGSNGSSATYLCQPSTQASAHYVITQTG